MITKATVCDRRRIRQYPATLASRYNKFAPTKRFFGNFRAMATNLHDAAFVFLGKAQPERRICRMCIL
jgi:hypothetical protein